MINWDKVDELREDIGAEDFDEIIEVFLEEVESELACVDEKPPADLGASMHFLKGSALNLGFHVFAEKCALGESLAAQSKAEEIDLTDLKSCYATSKEAFLQNCSSS